MRLEPARRRVTRISLTPLIDVVFILLLFFMLTTRFGQHQAMTLDLPGKRGALETTTDSVSLHLASDGSFLTAAGQRVASRAFRTHPAMQKIVADDPQVRIDVDDDVTLQTLVQALDVLESFGVDSVSVSGLRR